MNLDQPNILRKLAAASALLAAIRRTGSFSAAGADLGQTQSTVSHKVQALERAIGFQLFERTTRQVSPTLKGQIICEAAQASVDALYEALNRVDHLNTAQETVLTLSSSLAMKWLVPAMTRAQERGLQISFQISDALSDIGAAGQPQVAIRFGVGPYPGLHAELLTKCHIFSVRSTSGRSLSGATAAHPARLLRDSRAESDGTALGWEDYLSKADLTVPSFETGAEFERSDLALQAAVAGLGHALGRTLLTETDIGGGLLVVDGPAVPVAGRYWLVTTAEHAGTQSYAQVAAWLKSEVEHSDKILRSHLAR